MIHASLAAKFVQSARHFERHQSRGAVSERVQAQLNSDADLRMTTTDPNTPPG